MSLWKIAWRSIQQRALSSWLTGLSMALGVALVVIVVVINSFTQQFFGDAAQGYHLIVGTKGGKTQLVLNTVFHMSQSLEPMPWSYYQEFVGEDGKFSKRVEQAIPYCLGDTYKGFRCVATIPDLFDNNPYTWDKKGNPTYYTFREGRNFRDALSVSRNEFEAAAFEAVVGSVAAKQTGLKIGDRFAITHGVEGHSHDEDQFTVVGILNPTGTPNDRGVFINMEGFYLLGGHALDEKKPVENKTDTHEDAHAHGDEHAHEDDHEHEDGHAHDHGSHAHGSRRPLADYRREVTSIMVRMSGSDPTMAVLNAGAMAKEINEGRDAQAVFPLREVTLLLNMFVAPLRWVLLALTVAIVIVACIGVMVSIYNSMSERTREIAVIRSLGAGRETVMAIVLLESMMLALFGGLAGIVLGHGAIGLFAPWVASELGFPLEWLHFSWLELVLVPSLIVLAAGAGFLPAFTAYRTDVAKALSAAP